jgi:hypothetical protein
VSARWHQLLVLLLLVPRTVCHLVSADIHTYGSHAAAAVYVLMQCMS